MPLISERVLLPGDTMRWSLQLAQQLLERQARTPEGIDTVVLTVVDIRTGSDGHKVVTLELHP